jgi:hypothetical protein
LGAAGEFVSTFAKQSIVLNLSSDMSQPSGNSPPAPSSGGSGSGSGQAEEARGNQSRKKKKKHFGSSDTQSGYTGKCDELKAYVYDVSPGKSGFETFAKTTIEIGQYIARTIKEAGEFRTAMDPDNLGFATLTAPADPIDPTNVMQMERWKVEYKEYKNALDLSTDPR